MTLVLDGLKFITLFIVALAAESFSIKTALIKLTWETWQIAKLLNI